MLQSAAHLAHGIRKRVVQRTSDLYLETLVLQSTANSVTVSQ